MITFYLKDYTKICDISQEKNDEKYRFLIFVLNRINNEIIKGTIRYGKRKKCESQNEKIVDIFNGCYQTQGLVGAILLNNIDYSKKEWNNTVLNSDTTTNTVDTSISLNILFPNEQLMENDVPYINDKKENNKVKIIVGSRFDDDIRKPYFLATMLSCANLVNSSAISNFNEDDLFDFLLVSLYNNKLKEASKIGIYKKYVRFSGKIDSLKGSINFDLLINNSIGNISNGLYCDYEERTIANEINALIVSAYDSLKRRFSSSVDSIINSDYDSRTFINNLKTEFSYSDFNISNILSKTTKQITNSIYSSYEELRLLCRKILFFEGISPFESSEDSDTDAILYYIPDLWEEFLEATLFNDKRIGNCDVSFQKELRAIITIRPDYVVWGEKDKKPFAILDAKFKPCWSEDNICNRPKYEPHDVREVLSNMYLYDCDVGGIIAPTKKTDGKEYSIDINDKISIYKKEKSWFYRILVCAPKLDDNINTYNKYKEELLNSIANLKNKLNSDENFGLKTI